MKKLLSFIFISLFAGLCWAQAIYGLQGQYQGYQQMSPSGVTTNYNAQGQSTGSFQTDAGQTNFYGQRGDFQGTATTPITTQPNTTINNPGQVPTAPSIKGW